jgi:TonB-dependent starch-binding outer membrane protein SusC
MKRLLQKNCKTLAVVLFLVVFACPGFLWSQIYASSSQTTPRPQDGARDYVNLRDVLFNLGNHFNVSILFEERSVENLTTDQFVDYTLTVEENLKRLLSPFGLEYKKVKKDSYMVKLRKQIKTRDDDQERDIQTSDLNAPKEVQVFESAPLTPLAFTVTGKITDETSSPLPGVNILEKGTTNGTVTDAEGAFTINVTDANAVLLVTYIGYTMEEIAVAGRSTIDVKMTPDVKSLSEVVVIGYGAVRQRDLTGSVSSVKSTDLRMTPTPNLQQALQGRAAGVDVVQGGGNPGAVPRIRIRGSNSISGNNDPLYVVDGFPTTGGIESLNPGDIESIEVLKDASATAIYGSRGANGVILITTRNGKSGSTKIDFEHFTGFNYISNPPEMLNTEQFRQLAQEAVENNGRTFVETRTIDNEANTNWLDQILQTGIQQNYQLSLSGGNDKTKFLISGNYYNEKGIVKNSDFTRANVRFNLSSQVTDKLKFGINTTVGRNLDNSLPTGGDGGVDRGGVISTSLFVPPTVPISDPNTGNYIFNYELYRIFNPANNQTAVQNYQGQNPVSMVNELVNINSVFRILGNTFAEYEIIKGLKFKTLWGVSINYNKRNQYTPSNTFTVAGTRGAATVSMAEGYNWLNENTLNYDKVLGKHSVGVLAGYTIQRDKREDLAGNAQNFVSDAFQFNSLEQGAVVGTGSGASDWTILSYLGRINYIFSDKYLVTLTGRYDGSSRFSANNKYAFFPSGSIAWRISEESFLKDQQIVSDLKLRFGYGVTGNTPSSSYQSLARLNNGPTSGGPSNNYVFGGTASTGTALGGLGNPDLKWEKTVQYNAGLDIAFLDGRVSASLDFYSKVTQDLLLPVNLPGHLGVTSILRNLGEVENKGIEFTINGTIIDRNQLKWTSSFNLTANRNKVLTLNGSAEQIIGQGPFFASINQYAIIREGQPLGAFYGYRADGIFQSVEEVNAHGVQNGKAPGEIRYVDEDVSGTVDGSDRLIIGNPYPDFIGGLNNTVTYKGFDLNVFITGTLGVDRFNMTRYGTESLNGIFNNSTTVLNRWTPTNPSNDIPRAFSGTRVWRPSTREVEDASYLRFRTITLGYSLPQNVLERIKVRSARIYATGFNLFTITNYSGFDPESTSTVTSDTVFGADFGSYPRPKTFVFGVSIGF